MQGDFRKMHGGRLIACPEALFCGVRPFLPGQRSREGGREPAGCFSKLKGMTDGPGRTTAFHLAEATYLLWSLKTLSLVRPRRLMGGLAFKLACGRCEL